MIPLIALAAGIVIGWLRAARRGGGTADKLQYAAGHAIAFGLIAFAALVIAERAGLFAPGAAG